MKRHLLAIIFLASGIVTGQAASLSDAELDTIHAGFIQAGGMEFSLGAMMTSYVDGKMVLQSTMTMNETGLASQHTFGAGAQPLNAAAAAGISVGLPPVGAGAFVPGVGGGTAFVHTFTTDQLSNAVLNSASDRSIQQNTNVTVTIPDLAGLQQQFALAGLASRLHNTIGLGLVGAAQH